jgi:WD40 repeat protein
LIKIGGYLGIIQNNDSGICKGFKDEERDSTVKEPNPLSTTLPRSNQPITQPSLPHSLIIYDLPSLLTKTPVRIKEIKASLSFYSDNILLTSLGHSLSIYSNLNHIASISLPMIPTCFCTDLLFTKIYCGTKTGTILCINFDGSTNKLLDFHKNAILKLSFSFCNQYLYSLDSKGLLCIWDVKGNVVIDKMEIEGTVNFDSVLLGNVSSSNGDNNDLEMNDLEMPSIFK